MAKLKRINARISDAMYRKLARRAGPDGSISHVVRGLVEKEILDEPFKPQRRGLLRRR